MIGGVYAWSIFTGPIVKQTGWAETSVSFAFSLAIFFLGMSAAFMGRLVEKFRPQSLVQFLVFVTVGVSF
jgi:OFA family oxalate/formate antiporter-like MFS transporter